MYLFIIAYTQISSLKCARASTSRFSSLKQQENTLPERNAGAGRVAVAGFLEIKRRVSDRNRSRQAKVMFLVQSCVLSEVDILSWSIPSCSDSYPVVFVRPVAVDEDGGQRFGTKHI